MVLSLQYGFFDSLVGWPHVSAQFDFSYYVYQVVKQIGPIEYWENTSIPSFGLLRNSQKQHFISGKDIEPQYSSPYGEQCRTSTENNFYDNYL